jgi:hypothetical protein
MNELKLLVVKGGGDSKERLYKKEHRSMGHN